MKNLLALLCLILSSAVLCSQTEFNKVIPVEAAENLAFDFEYSNVTFKTWEQNEVKINGTIEINLGLDDDAFEFKTNNRNGSLYIKTSVDTDDLPKRKFATINGVTTLVNKAEAKMSDKYDSFTFGSKVDIELVIYIPREMELEVDSKYGSITLEEVSNSIVVNNIYGGIEGSIRDFKKLQLESTYGIVDIKILKSTKANFKLRTDYGKIFTDLDFEMEKDFLKKRRSDFGERINCTLNGGGEDIKIEATYSNIYIRQA